MDQDLSNFFPENTRSHLLKLYDLLIEKAILKVYNNLDEEEKGNFIKILKDGTDEEKGEFLKKYLKEFKEFLIEDIRNISEEIKNSLKGN